MPSGASPVGAVETRMDGGGAEAAAGGAEAAAGGADDVAGSGGAGGRSRLLGRGGADGVVGRPTFGRAPAADEPGGGSGDRVAL
jgi:hypothetical protein